MTWQCFVSSFLWRTFQNCGVPFVICPTALFVFSQFLTCPPYLTILVTVADKSYHDRMYDLKQSWLFTYLFLKYPGQKIPNTSPEQNISCLFQWSKLTRWSKRCLPENCQTISPQTKWETLWNTGKIWGSVQQARSQPSLMQARKTLPWFVLQIVIEHHYQWNVLFTITWCHKMIGLWYASTSHSYH